MVFAVKGERLPACHGVWRRWTTSAPALDDVAGKPRFSFSAILSAGRFLVRPVSDDPDAGAV
jgi:hypothetical protein